MTAKLKVEIVRGAAGVIFVALVMVFYVYLKTDSPTPPDAGPPSPHRDAVEFVRHYDYETTALWEIEVNRLVNEGCTLTSTYAAIGGPVAVMECGE